MRILLLNGANHDDQTAEELIKGFKDSLINAEVNIVNLYSTEIASCLGCFGCWIKTPGICVIDDAGRTMAKNVMESDVVIAITPITFGGYSYNLKKFYDRLIPIISPFFTKIDGEIHHKPRYERYPKCITIGITTEKGKQEEVFRNLVKRNAINMHSAIYLSEIVERSSSVDELQAQVNRLIEEAGVR
jgi:multimeric flavodoxin WrbA